MMTRVGGARRAAAGGLMAAALVIVSVSCRDQATRSATSDAGGAAGDGAEPCGTGAAATAAARDTGNAAAPRVTTIVVNRGTHGMAARVRWTLSPDRCALLVVEDPAGVENDPVPNGFVLASERGGGVVVQRDSAWDVAPSPDWTRLAYGRAYALPGGERDSMTVADWAELGRRAGLDAATARRGAFASSGMTTAYALARPVIVAVSDSVADHALPIANGWRVRWTRDGRALVLGSRPVRANDDAPPTQWDVVDAGTPAARSASERAQSLGGDVSRVDAAWTDGPTIDISVAPSLDSAAAIAVDGGTVESRGGTVWLRTRGRSATAVSVGPGAALAATRGGRFIVALAPAPNAARYESKVRLVVYRVER
ncbi:MAG TPA: hypothetical protein VNS52_10935 [Gemmatimonadaceae bacterium]|nr:hypothetical protein [Gemmatimonadaceae bacterium]